MIISHPFMIAFSFPFILPGRVNINLIAKKGTPAKHTAILPVSVSEPLCIKARTRREMTYWLTCRITFLDHRIRPFRKALFPGVLRESSRGKRRMAVKPCRFANKTPDWLRITWSMEIGRKVSSCNVISGLRVIIRLVPFESRKYSGNHASMNVASAHSANTSSQ